MSAPDVLVLKSASEPKPRIRIIILIVIILAALPFFFLGGAGDVSTPLFRAVWNLGHIVFFGLVLVLVQLRWPLPHPQHWLWVVFWVFLVGGSIELVQTLVGREGSWSDIWRNLLGAGLGLFWGQRATLYLWLARVIMLTALCIPLWSVSQVAYLQYSSAKNFPLLAGFEHERELQRWTGDIKRVKRHVSEGNYALKIRFGTEAFSGIKLDWYLGDWSHSKQLRFDLYNPDTEPLALTLRINDLMHDQQGSNYNDRLNFRLLIKPGWNHLVLPLSQIKAAPKTRDMNLSEITELGIFAMQLAEERVVYFDNLRLE